MTRFYALDRLRALAVVLMVQGHTFSALMAEDALPKNVMHWHALLHGLTAPAFLFGAGLAFGLATYPHYAQHHQGGHALHARLRRYAWLIVLGYALQLPGASLFAAFRMRLEDLAPVLRVGPLHLIAFCLGLAQLSALWLRSARWHAALSFAAGAAITLVAPCVYASDAGQLAGPFLGPWLDASSGSLFPIFPWGGFVFFGVAVGGLLALRSLEQPRATVWIALGVFVAGSAYVLFLMGIRLADPKWFWHASPLNVAFRVGLVLCLLGLLQQLPTPPDRVRHRTWTSRLARHSLVAFVVHLLLLYGTPFTPSLNKHFALRLDAPQASGVFAAIMALTMVAAWAWDALHQERRLNPSWVRMGLTAVCFLVLMR